MNSAICTLFEGHYHFGLAALINSLHKHGYEGNIYAGYRGVLPNWAASAKPVDTTFWPGGKVLSVADKLKVFFLPIDTNYHLANCKPSFMLSLWDGIAKEAENLYYFDPDILNKCSWSFYEKWANFGVALVYEIANNPMPSTHPVRLGWIEVVELCNKSVTKNLNYYFNSGFCGVSKSNISFITLWHEIIETAVKNKLFDPSHFVTLPDRTQHFDATDQDALNIAAMCCEVPLSEMGPDGMDFTPGGWMMSHATGSPKPWKKNYILSALKGSKPSRADRVYWEYANGLILNYTPFELKKKHISIKIAALIGRFYSNS